MYTPFALLYSLALAFALPNIAKHSQVPDRVFVVGDLHGDYQEADRLMRAANVTDVKGDWLRRPDTTTWLVQLGDIVDRGPDSLPLYEKFQRLSESAAKQGDLVINLLGNHELLNLCNQFHYLSQDEFINHYNGDHTALHKAWSPTGDVGAFVRKHFEVGVKLDDVVFVHAGLEPRFARQDFHDMKKQLLDSVDNQQCRHQEGVIGAEGPLWTRKIARGDCGLLDTVLRDQNARAMVVGHTPTESGNVEVACKGRLVMADVGISRWVRGSPRMLLLEKRGTLPMSQWHWMELALTSSGLSSTALRSRTLLVGSGPQRVEI
ncbi:MAG: hypothetical protein KVP17_004935 [Porospora cf. gigantea B]|uniref:uncharacterized protein n=1 Tax=Porospora cf. gigantea B TaxID=2853592 RepID=UPI003571C852|nr:MAG: hypothetical protein KVP17_004935 [Porospora cf. gigantea B]